MPNFGVVTLLRYAKNKSFMTSTPGPFDTRTMTLFSKMSGLPDQSPIQ